ncbi:macrolide family glycosyltransferase [Saccharomonospora xinjiangensis]|uniref:macrolide family glycosyltransferase n=1 Tax=Saccharomonospora xinjiangensis TaxID=75294 RepID=UPI00106F545E|nr:macrolide family glycosyltransferase [Saccharomonospora xinjiangensis]QBQ60553.1 Oleandomycin glycosyltransferase [Saccharomonospora xinjiangensis]
MGRHILFASIPAWGHLYPVLPGLAELVRRGHRVSCLASGGFAGEVGKVLDVVPYDSPMDSTEVDLADMGSVLPMMLAETRAAYSVLADVVRADPPEVIVSDVLSNAGWLLGRAFDLPVVRTWPVFASNSEFSLHEDYTSRTDTEESMTAFFRSVAAFLDEVGLDTVSPEQFFDNEAEHNIALFPRALQPRGETFDARFTFISPCIRPAEGSPEVPWLARSQPLAVVSLGTVFNEKIDFFRTCLDGIDRLGWYAAAALGNRVNPAAIGPVSPRVLVTPTLPMIDALRHASVAVTHGGLTSTLEALAEGVPVLISPQIGEQRGVADRVEALGLGHRLPDPFTAEELAELIKQVSQDSAMAERLDRFRATVRDADGPAQFADAVEAVPR